MVGLTGHTDMVLIGFSCLGCNDRYEENLYNNILLVCRDRLVLFLFISAVYAAIFRCKELID